MIPKIAHFYWGGGLLPFARYLSIRSFCKLNEDWRIILWESEYPSTAISWGTGELDYQVSGRDYLSDLYRIIPERLIAGDPGIGYLHDAQRADWIRLESLYGFGGWYIDSDILFIRSMSEIELGEDIDLSLTRFPDYYQTAFVGSSVKNQVLVKLMEATKTTNRTDYQKIGWPVWWDIYPEPELFPCKSKMLSPDVVHPFEGTEMEKFWDAMHMDRIKNETIGVHWFAGSPVTGKWINLITEDSYSTFDNTFSALCREFNV